MGFTKNALFPNTQKQQGIFFPFWQINSISVFPNSKPQPKQMGFSAEQFPTHILAFILYQNNRVSRIFQSKKNNRNSDNPMELKKTMMIHYEQI